MTVTKKVALVSLVALLAGGFSMNAALASPACNLGKKFGDSCSFRWNGTQQQGKCYYTENQTGTAAELSCSSVTLSSAPASNEPVNPCATTPGFKSGQNCSYKKSDGSTFNGHCALDKSQPMVAHFICQ